MTDLSSELMGYNDAQERFALMRKSESAEFINEMAEVRLKGTFNVNDLEALYVLMLFAEGLPSSGEGKQ